MIDMKSKIEEVLFIIKILDLKPQLQYSESQTSRILGLSASTLWRMRKEGIGLDYKKRETTSRSNNGRVMYSISSIAEYYFSNIKTA